MEFLDNFLMNVRKDNDIYKLQLSAEKADMSPELTRSETSGFHVQSQLNSLLELVLRIFFRISNRVEDEELELPLDFYQKLLYNYKLFDMAKLFDLAAIFG